jgi:xanthine/CO dehydrogenase XdhC/CoxF family maturation factor
MLLAQDGRRAGTVSGGCLEAEVARRAWWLTEGGPAVERYSTLEDDGDLPYGSGCGGVVFILLERRETAFPLLTALETAFIAREPLATATVLKGRYIGRRAFVGLTQCSEETELSTLASVAMELRTSVDQNISIEGTLTRVWVDYRAARPGLWIFGAGDDARPLLHLARELGWFVAIVDGRSHLATKNRFASANDVIALPIAELPENSPKYFNPHASDAAVLMTHSFEQDTRILASLMRETKLWPLAYIGILGPQRRTREALSAAARLLNISPTIDRVDQWLTQLHAPTGIDLGADTPASIALSILAEIQQTLNAATALPLRHVRATGVTANL